MCIYFKPLETHRLIIMELKIEDSSDFYTFLANSNVARFMSWEPYIDENLVVDLINKTISQYGDKIIYRLGIEVKSLNKIIGFIGLSRFDLSETTCQVVYAIDEPFWGMGIMSEALMAFVDYLMNTQNKKLIIGTHMKDNISSGKVLLKSGFRRDTSRDTYMKIKGKDELLIAYTIEKEV